MRTVYLDYNATTPLDPKIQSSMLPFLDSVWGNPSSIHHLGRKARAVLDDARDRCSTVFGCRPSEIIFTSGGTESSNLAIFGTARRLRAKGRHLITSSIEHHAVLHSFRYLEQREGFEVTYLPVDRSGLVSPQSLKEALRPDTVLVSIMAANNEVGTIQPVSELGATCRDRGILFHTDAVQWFGKSPFTGVPQFNADLVSCCAHKIHGPKGAGLLYARSPLFPEPIIYGGGHENEHRAGTENLAAIVGLVLALERFVRQPVFAARALSPLAELFLNTLSGMEGVYVLGTAEHRLPNTVSFVVRDADSIALLAGLDLEGICASSGSACSSGSLEPSHVVLAMGFDNTLANSLIRFSLGRENTHEEVSLACSILPEVVRRVQVLENRTSEM